MKGTLYHWAEVRAFLKLIIVKDNSACACTANPKPKKKEEGCGRFVTTSVKLVTSFNMNHDIRKNVGAFPTKRRAASSRLKSSAK